MNLTQKLLLLASSVGLVSGSAHGQANAIVFEFLGNSVANYRQNPNTVNFEGGVFSLRVRDGQFAWTGQPCQAPFFFNPSMPCPLGSTGFVSRGLENDPELNGLGPYFSVTDIFAAQILRPFDPLSARLVAAPPSLLPRPLLGFQDRSLSVFFNLFTPFIRQYPISTYSFAREYTSGERSRFDGEVVPGTYRYNFGSLASPTIPVVLELNQFPMLDGFRKVNNQNRGFRFTNVKYDDGFALIDPFQLNTLTWEGNTFNFISPGADILYLSIKRLTNPSDPLSDPSLIETPLFPTFAAASIPIPQRRILLPSALDTSFILPPNFVQPGQTGVIDLEFIVFRPTSSVIYERATRRFRLPVRVTNPFDSFIAAALPPGATALQKSADYDFDGDGVSNFHEWVFGSDPANPGSVPKAPGMKVLTSSPTSPDSSSPESLVVTKNGLAAQSELPLLEYRVEKLTNSVPKLKYAIEYSEDMNEWSEIKAGDPEWNLVETYDEIKVVESGDTPKTGGFFRARVEVAN